VITTVGAADKFDRARELGAAEVLDHVRDDIAKGVRAKTGGKGADVVIEHAGGPVFDGAFRALARNGRLVTCGATAGHEAAIDLNVLFGRHLTVMGSWMGRRSDLNDALKHVASGALRPVVDSAWPLAHAREAHDRMETRGQFGKLVLVP
jgi:NADPH:quinone reductase-like Zn-dependent oxidoreductase